MSPGASCDQPSWMQGELALALLQLGLHHSLLIPHLLEQLVYKEDPQSSSQTLLIHYSRDAYWSCVSVIINC